MPIISYLIIQLIFIFIFQILSALCLASALAEPEADALNAYTYVNYGGKMMPVTRYNGFRPHEFRTNTYTGFPNTFTGFPNTYTGRPNTYTGYAVGSPYPGYPFAIPSYESYPSDTSFYNNRVSYNTVSGFRAPFLNRYVWNIIGSALWSFLLRNPNNFDINRKGLDVRKIGWEFWRNIKSRQQSFYLVPQMQMLNSEFRDFANVWSSVRPEPLFWFRSDSETKTKIRRYFQPIP